MPETLEGIIERATYSQAIPNAPSFIVDDRTLLASVEVMLLADVDSLSELFEQLCRIGWNY